MPKMRRKLLEWRAQALSNNGGYSRSFVGTSLEYAAMFLECILGVEIKTEY
jgi:hypothetical protein